MVVDRSDVPGRASLALTRDHSVRITRSRVAIAASVPSNEIVEIGSAVVRRLAGNYRLAATG